jgi:D-alanyl-lipoteichoic acid acyltransferase DltB (MBOAT superfamily)
MVNKLKTLLTSDEGMKVVNLLFLLSLLIQNRGIIFIAYIVWIAYLVYCIKRTSSKSVKIINGIFVVFAAVMIAFNVYFLVVKLITSSL